MSLPTIPSEPARLTNRFFMTSYFPTYAGLLSLLVLVWATRGQHTVSFADAWRTAAALKAGEILVITLGTLLIALVLQPFQLGIVRLLEGSWPPWLGASLAERLQRRGKAALERAAAVPAGTLESNVTVIRTAGVAGSRLRRTYPLPDHLVRPTKLGNVLAAMEDTAGRAYGLDAVVAWPRLYPLLGDPVKGMVDDRRNLLDFLARLAVTAFLTSVTAVVILWGTGWWTVLAAAPASIAVMSYAGAIQAATAYSEAVCVAFDIHHLKLAEAAHLSAPADPEKERLVNRELCDLWRQGIPPTFTYAATAPSEDSPK